MVAEALPSLDLICLEDQASYIEEFVAFRQLSDRPLTVVGTEAEFDQRLGERLRMSYTHFFLIFLIFFGIHYSAPWGA